MITHEEARKNIIEVEKRFPCLLFPLTSYVIQQEKLEKELKLELRIAVRNIETLNHLIEEKNEELRLLNISDTSKEESSMQYYNDYKDLKRKYEKVSKLLELYQYLWKKPVIYQEYSLEQIQKMIDKLEGELK